MKINKKHTTFGDIGLSCLFSEGPHLYIKMSQRRGVSLPGLVWCDFGFDAPVTPRVASPVEPEPADDGLEALDPKLHMVYSAPRDEFGLVCPSGNIFTRSKGYLNPLNATELGKLRDMGFRRILRPTEVTEC